MGPTFPINFAHFFENGLTLREERGTLRRRQSWRLPLSQRLLDSALHVLVLKLQLENVGGWGGGELLNESGRGAVLAARLERLDVIVDGDPDDKEERDDVDPLGPEGSCKGHSADRRCCPSGAALRHEGTIKGRL